MSFYPLVTLVAQFRELDGWMMSLARRTYNERARILSTNFGISQGKLTDKSFVSGDWYNYDPGYPLETSLPSLTLAWRAARKAYRQYGMESFEELKYYSLLM